MATEPPPEGSGAPSTASAADPAEPKPLPHTDEPLVFLLAVQNNAAVDIRTRVRAAIAAAQYKHTKRADGGKKEELAGKAKVAAQGRFGSRPAPPALKVVGKNG